MVDNIKIIKAIVVAIKANYFIVEIEKDQKLLDDRTNIRLLCTKRNRLSYQGSMISVGDVVCLDAIDFNNFTAVINTIEPRRSFISRPSLANFTHIFIVLSLENPRFDRIQATRFLLQAEETGQNISLLITKSDLVNDDLLIQNINRFEEWGYETNAISIINGFGIQQFEKKLSSIDLGLLCGPSGVGKSSLIKYLLPKQLISIGSLSKKLKRGMHTTRHVELFSISKGCFLADTPGFNKPECNSNIDMLPKLFPEIRSRLENDKCKFRNCLHLDEPGCSISKDWERYQDYKIFMEDILNQRH